MVRVPASWVRAGMAGLAGGNRARYGSALARVPVTPDHRYVIPVTVDLGNDGMAPVATFAAAGTATALAGPSSSGDVWSLDQCSVSTSIGPLDAAQCSVFAGPLPLPQFLIAPSLAGGGTQFGLGGVGVPFGWFLYAVWSGGTPGATAFLRVTGVKRTMTD